MWCWKRCGSLFSLCLFSLFVSFYVFLSVSLSLFLSFSPDVCLYVSFVVFFMLGVCVYVFVSRTGGVPTHAGFLLFPSVYVVVNVTFMLAVTPTFVVASVSINHVCVCLLVWTGPRGGARLSRRADADRRRPVPGACSGAGFVSETAPTLPLSHRQFTRYKGP